MLRNTISNAEIIQAESPREYVAYPEGFGCSTAGTRKLSWWMWPHLCSLDAPAVAMVWQWWWLRHDNATLTWQPAVVLALSIWLIYLADRWVDGCRHATTDQETARHRFSSEYRVVIGYVVVALTASLMIITPWILARREFLTGLGLLVAAALYFGMTHGPMEKVWMAFLPKEAAVGVLFAVGTSTFVLCRQQHAVSILLVGVSEFALLCFANCALITRWERTRRDLQDPQSLLNAFPKLESRLPVICMALTTIAVGSSLLSQSELFLPLAVGAAFLGYLDFRSPMLSLNTLRVLADVVLLTPLLFLLPKI